MIEIIVRSTIDLSLILIAVVMLINEEKFIDFEDRIAEKLKKLFKAD